MTPTPEQINDAIATTTSLLNRAEKVGLDNDTDKAIASDCRIILHALRATKRVTAWANAGDGTPTTAEQIGYDNARHWVRELGLGAMK